jgi:hypothetical protein
MGQPTASVVQNNLVSATLNPVVYNSLLASGSTIFGAGVLGANYSSSTVGAATYRVSNTQTYTVSGSNSYTLGLLTMGAYGAGFSSLSFSVSDDGTTLLAKRFTNLARAENYFTDDPLSLGNLAGTANLKVSFTLTGTMAEGAGISYVLADGVAPPAGRVKWGSGGALAAALAKFNAAWAHTRYDLPSRLLPLPMRRGSTDLVGELLRKEGRR